jgi:hypothetical protein
LTSIANDNVVQRTDGRSNERTNDGQGSSSRVSRQYRSSRIILMLHSSKDTRTLPTSKQFLLLVFLYHNKPETAISADYDFVFLRLFLLFFTV